jgi:hypothetical protein
VTTSSEHSLLLAMVSGEQVSIAPQHAVGWTHVWDGSEQLPLTDEQAAALAYLGFIFYSPWDGPNARVYRLCEGVPLAQVKGAIGG